MNKKIIEKLNLIFLGIENRFNENQNFFVEINVLFKDGLKTFNGKAVLNDNNTLSFRYLGFTKNMSLKAFLDFIKDEALKYNSLEMEYVERGSKMIVNANNRSAIVKTEELKEEIKEKETDPETSSLLNRNYYIKANKATHLLKILGIIGEDGKVKNDMIRKYNQIDRYIELLDKDFDKLENIETPINIIDIGCGKSYLSFALNYYLTEVRKIKANFIGIDISKDVIETSKAMQKDLGYRNMDFIVSDIKDFEATRSFDIVISLHACDTATDIALAFGVYNKSSIIVAVPCCHREMLNTYSYEPFKEIMKHGLLKKRLADTLTDGLRALLLEANGYDVSVIEYISPLETPKNLMIKASKTNEINKISEKSARDLIKAFDIYPSFKVYLDEYKYKNQ
ncbi:MAG: SAM-dependent methyltransferase [Clostridium sp.]|nr:SAM-dependent methyltransferase [Clostridium sp.]